MRDLVRAIGSRAETGSGWIGARGLALVWALVVGGCDDGADAGRDASEVASDAGDVVDGEVREVVGAAAVMSGSPRSVPRDDLFPDMAGDDLVWTSLWLDKSVAGAAADTDCVECPYCTGCRADLLTRRLPDGPVVTVYAAPRVIGAARVGDGVVSFRDEGGELMAFDLATREVTRLTGAAGYAAWAGVPHAGALWFYAYDPGQQRYMFRACAIDGSRCDGKLEASVRDETRTNGTNVAELGRRQPFTVAGGKLLWTGYDGGSTVMSWSFDGRVTTEAESTELMYRAPLAREDGVVIAQGYESAGGCWSADCALGFWRIERGVAEPFLLAARPTRFVAPAMAGDRLVWVDRDEASYVVMSADPAGLMQRVSGDGAEVGTSSNLAASGRRVAWAERRQGRWRIVGRTL